MTEIDFVAVKKHFDEKLSNGDRAEIRRVIRPDDLAMIPAYYRLLAASGAPPSDGMERVVYMLAHAGHRDNGKSVGEAFKKGGVSEARLFQMMRSERPRDMEHLRRLLRQVKPTVDWREFGKTLFYWNERNKRNIVEQYFLSDSSREKNETKKEQGVA